MSSKDSDSSSDCDDHKKDPTFRAKVQVEDTDRSTHQTGSNLAKTAKKSCTRVKQSKCSKSSYC